MASTRWPRQPRFGEPGWWNRRRRAGVVAGLALGFAAVVVLGQADGWWADTVAVGQAGSSQSEAAGRPRLTDDLLTGGLGSEADGADGGGVSGDGGGRGPLAESVVGAGLDIDELLDLDLEFDCVDGVDGFDGDPVVVGVITDEALGALPPIDPTDDPIEAMAARHLAELINCAGGVDGRPAELVAVGAGGSALATRDAVVDVLGRQPVALIGPASLEVGLRVAEVVDGEVPMLFPLSAEPAFDAGDRGRYLLGPDAGDLARAAALYALDQGWVTAATFSRDDPVEQVASAAFVAAFEAGGGVVRAELPLVIEGGAVVVDDGQLDRLGTGSGIGTGSDVIFTGVESGLAGSLAAALEEAEVAAAVVVADRRVDVDLDGGAVDGVLLVGRQPRSGGDRVDRFRSSYTTATGVEFADPVAAARVADAMLVVLGAIERSGAVGVEAGVEAVAAQLAAGVLVEGLTGPAGVWVDGGVGEPIPIVEVGPDGSATLVASIPPPAP